MSIAFKRKKHNISAPAKALSWIYDHQGVSGGVLVHSKYKHAYPEVTGYTIPTLLNYGEENLAICFIKWLLCIQRANGGFTSPEGVPYIFDSGQILRGLIAGRNLLPDVIDAATRLGDYLCNEMEEQGKGGFGKRYNGDVPETVHLYVLPQLIELSKITNIPKYEEYAKNCLEFYIKHSDFLNIDELTHFLAYELEALIDLGRIDLVKPMLDELLKLQKYDGSIRGRGKVSWVCSTGLAQLAICWYKIGENEPADKAMLWLETNQNKSGGFYGSYGFRAKYFPKEEISWAVKYFLDANLLRITSFFDRNMDIFPDEVDAEDGRLKEVLSIIKPDDKIIEVGCGKGRFLKAIKKAYPDTECVGVDISQKLLNCVPSEIRASLGSIESTGCKSDYFDVVFSIEVIEHSANFKQSVDELIRIAKPGSKILIIDKQASHWGRLRCPDWERWPKKDEIIKLLNNGCDNVNFKTVAYDNRPETDGMMAVWSGQKRSILSGKDWSKILISEKSKKSIIKRISNNNISEWAKEIILHTKCGDKVLEIGSGTGEISLFLAQSGRHVSMVDISKENLEFSQKCANELRLAVNTIQADATKRMPFGDNEFDCVWQSGLLEHFTMKERQEMLLEWSRISSTKVISIVPNAACVAYRAGKDFREKCGTWPYGLEMPLHSLKPDYEAVGLKIINEYSVAAEQALNFLHSRHPLRKALKMLINSDFYKNDCNQGYLLVTIGEKRI